MPLGGAVAGGVSGIISGLAGLFGGGNQQKLKTSGTITNSGTSSGTSSASNTPNLSPYQTNLANLFTKGLASNYNNTTNLTGYTQGGLQDINNSANLSQKVLNNTLAARGQSFSPAATSAETMGQQSRLAQGNTFMSQIPLLQQQLKQQALGQAVAGFSALPTGTTQTGTQSQTSNNTQTQQGTNLLSGNPIAGLLGGLGSGLAAPTGSSGQSGLQNIIAAFGGGGGSTTYNPNSFGGANYTNYAGGGVAPAADPSGLYS